MHLRIFLASPGDVAAERALALQLFERLPYDPLLRGHLTLEPVAWDKPGAGTPMLATLTPQAAIAAGLAKPSDCDIVVVIVWSRMGTPLPMDQFQKPDGSAYLSGTEWEYLDAMAASKTKGRPVVLVYRRTEKIPVEFDDPQFYEKLRQYQNVSAFFASFNNPDGSLSGGYNEYTKPEDLRELLDQHVRDVIHKQLKNHQPEAAPSPTPIPAHSLWQGSPFPGLRAFTPDDAPIFFGRGREADELVEKLRDPACRFVVVVGASGSGKSSLVGAGLIPRLKDNAIEGSKDWLLPEVLQGTAGQRKQWTGLRFTPGEVGDNPFQALAVRLAPLLSDESLTPRKLAELLEAKPETLSEAIIQALRNRPAWSEALIFIDQFEELFTVVANTYIKPFVSLLKQPGRLRFVLTLRVDFYPYCVKLAELAERLRTGSFPLSAPRIGALHQMLVGPAACAGLEFEQYLPERILDDTGDDPGALALLAFALHELYEARTDKSLPLCQTGNEGDFLGSRAIPPSAPFVKGGMERVYRLTNAAYEQTGGVRSAIGKRAEDTFKKLPAASQEQISAVFRELVDVDTQGNATRRRVAYAELAKDEASSQLANEFIDSRLLVSDRTPEGNAVVEVAHEALFREWTRLFEWIVIVKDDLRLRTELTRAAKEWEDSGRKNAFLWPDGRLQPMWQMCQRLQPKLNKSEQDFLQPEIDRLQNELDDPFIDDSYRQMIGVRLLQMGVYRRSLDNLQNGQSLIRAGSPVIKIRKEDNLICYKRLTLYSPNRQILLKDLSLSIPHGTRILITDRTGMSQGASVALFQAMAGLWDYGKGQITLPPLNRIRFLPQRPYLPPGSLRELLCYNANNQTIPDHEIIDYIRELGLDSVLKRIGGLDVDREWGGILSLSEEQLFSFLRLLIAKPAFAFLDRSFTALPYELFAQMLLMLALRSISYFSFQGNSELKQLYDLELEIGIDGSWNINTIP